MRATLFFSALALAITRPVAADPRRCINDHAKGQELEKEARLLEARAAFLRCVGETGCPSVISKECADLHQRLDKNVPTLVFTAQVDAGRDGREISLYIDDRLVAKRLDGRAHEVDPGKHEARFVASDGTERRVSIVAAQGQKNQQVSADFRSKAVPTAGPNPKDETPAEPRASGVPVGVWVLGGVGVLALGSWAYFGIDGRQKQDDMEGEGGCAPYCEQSRADAMRRSYIFADLSLLVALVSFGSATVILLGSDSGSARTRTPALSVGARLGPKGSGVSLAGTFDVGVH